MLVKVQYYNVEVKEAQENSGTTGEKPTQIEGGVHSHSGGTDVNNHFLNFLSC
jgi:hypothetical protein